MTFSIFFSLNTTATFVFVFVVDLVAVVVVVVISVAKFCSVYSATAINNDSWW